MTIRRFVESTRSSSSRSSSISIAQMYDYYDKYVEAGSRSDKDAQERWSRQLIWEVARHAVGEEIVVYPLMEKHLGQRGLELADEDRAQHQVHPDNLNVDHDICSHHNHFTNVDRQRVPL